MTENPDRPRLVYCASGGGMKGMAHIGAWRAMLEHGIHPDAVVGTSIGALVGAALCTGMDVEIARLLALAVSRGDVIRTNRRLWLPGGVRQTSSFRGDHLADLIDHIVPVDSFADLTIPLRLNAVSLETGREIWFGSGLRTGLELKEAIRASCSLPVFFPPVSWGTHSLVDGAFQTMAGVDAALSWSGGRVLVCDVSADLLPAEASHWQRHGMLAIHERAVGILAERLLQIERARWERLPIHLVRPDVGQFGTFDFDHTDRIINAGYEAMARALESF